MFKNSEIYAVQCIVKIYLVGSNAYCGNYLISIIYGANFGYEGANFSGRNGAKGKYEICPNFQNYKIN